MEISSTFSILDITNWWRQQVETLSQNVNLSNMARDIISIIPHGVGVESSFSSGWDVYPWRQSQTTGEILSEKVIVRKFAQANNEILAGDDPALDTTHTDNDSEMSKEAEASQLHRMDKVNDLLEMWQGSQNLRAIPKESHAQYKQVTSVGYISDTEAIVKASWSIFQHDCLAAFQLSERSPLPPALSTKELPGGQTHILKDCRIRTINHHPVQCDEDSATECISETEDCLNWNGNFDIPNDTKDHCVADVESGIEHCNGIKDPECPEQRDESATPNVPALIQPTRKSMG